MPRLPFLDASLARLLRTVLVAVAAVGVCHSQVAPERMSAAAQRMGPAAIVMVQRLRPLLEQLAEAPEAERLGAVNRFVNQQVVFREDVDAWGAVDYWASPLEALSRGVGDCEDYAIAKYFTLVASGMPASRLRLVYVKAQLKPGEAAVAHMVLAYHATPGDVPLILDNLTTDVLPANHRPDLTPVFSFNSEGLWQGVAGQPAGDPVARLSRWREVLAKAQNEGFI